jgi:segregation and condensation protein A
VIVARFLALLELFREAAIAFDQEEALGELTVRWTGRDEGDLDVGDEFDEFDEGDEPEQPGRPDEPPRGGPRLLERPGHERATATDDQGEQT